VCIAAAVGLGCCLAHAQTVERPAVKAGDRWVYRDTTEVSPSVWNQTRDEALVSRVSASSIYFSTREVGSPNNVRERLATLEWGITRDVNGAETLVNRPLAFPLTPGKSWGLEFTEQNPNKKHDWEK